MLFCGGSTKEVTLKKHYKAISILLSVAMFFALATVALTAPPSPEVDPEVDITDATNVITFTVPLEWGGLPVTYPVTIEVPIEVVTTNGDFAGVEFEFEIENGLTVKDPFFVLEDDKGGTVMLHTRVPTPPATSYRVALLVTSNAFVPVNDKLVVGSLFVEFDGDDEAAITIKNGFIARADGTLAKQEAFSGGAQIIIKRNPASIQPSPSPSPGTSPSPSPGTSPSPSPGTGPSPTPGRSGSTGGTTTGGLSSIPPLVTPPIQIGDDDEVPAGPSDEVDEFVIPPFISGFPDGTFQPDGPLTRAQLAQIFYNLYAEGQNSSVATYTDIEVSYWGYRAIAFCQETGYMIGYPDGSFMPEQMLTRAEMSTAATRIIDIDQNPENPFSDVGDHWARGYIGALYSVGIVEGYPDGTFRPQNTVNRSEAVTIICRAVERNHTLYDSDTTFSDIDRSHWSYDYVMHAANGYTYQVVRPGTDQEDGQEDTQLDEAEEEGAEAEENGAGDLEAGDDAGGAEDGQGGSDEDVGDDGTGDQEGEEDADPEDT